MTNATKLAENPEHYSTAVSRFADLAVERAALVWGTGERTISSVFHPTDVAKIVAEDLSVELLKAREIAELERDIAERRLARALAELAHLRAA